MNTQEQISAVTELVTGYFKENCSYTGLSDLLHSEEQHVIQIGTSILCTKWNVGYEGGGFVKAVVNNNLSAAVGSADTVNITALKFYCQLMYNVGKPAIFNLDIDEDHDLDQVLNNMAKDLDNE
jgi:hypothetical protein